MRILQIDVGLAIDGAIARVIEHGAIRARGNPFFPGHIGSLEREIPPRHFAKHAVGLVVIAVCGDAVVRSRVVEFLEE